MTPLRPAARCRAEAFGTKLSSEMAASTRARVEGRTMSGRLRTLETVPSETPALAATSLMLTLAIPAPFAGATYPGGRRRRPSRAGAASRQGKGRSRSGAPAGLGAADAVGDDALLVAARGVRLHGV